MVFPEQLSQRNIDNNPTRQFQILEGITSTLLHEGEVLSPREIQALGVDSVLIAGNSVLRKKHLKLRPVDRSPIGSVDYPGKSAMLDFYGVLRHGGLSERAMAEFIQRSFGGSRELKRQDHAWRASLEDILNASFLPFYTPTRGNKLHLRLVWGGHVPAIDVKQVPQEVPSYYMEKLISVFSRVEITS